MLQNSTNNRNLGIDFLRAISISFVVLLHLNIHLQLSASPLNEILSRRAFLVLFWSGYYGVVIFFTLSGYLITTNIFRRWELPSTIDLRTYYAFRFFRIMPLLILLLILLTVLHFCRVEGFVISEEQTSIYQSLFAALTFHFNWHEINVGYLPGNWDVLWTISIEELFYLVLPLLFLLVRNKWMLLVIFIALLLFSPYSRSHFFLANELGDRNNFNYLDCFAFGVATAILVQNVKYSKVATIFAGVFGFCLLMLVIGFRGELYKMGITSMGFDLTFLCAGIALLLFWMHFYFDRTTVQFIPFRWFCSLGKYSYEIYLSHMFVVLYTTALFKNLGIGNNLKPLAVLIAFVFCWLLGAVSFHCFSHPINQKLRAKMRYK